MKQLLFIFLFFAGSAFAENFVLDNLTSFPTKNGKIAVQWASSAKEVDEANKALMQRLKWSPVKMESLLHAGKITLAIPKKAEYFRVLAWSKGDGEPDLHTNWVQIVPNKTFTLEADHLVPVSLMQGCGC